LQYKINLRKLRYQIHMKTYACQHNAWEMEKLSKHACIENASYINSHSLQNKDNMHTINFYFHLKSSVKTFESCPIFFTKVATSFFTMRHSCCCSDRFKQTWTMFNRSGSCNRGGPDFTTFPAVCGKRYCRFCFCLFCLSRLKNR